MSNLVYIGLFVGIIVVTIVVALLVNRFFLRLFRKSSEIVQHNPTNFRFLRHAIVALIHLVGFSLAIYIMPDLRAVASSMLAGAGILAVAVGFASQKALSNIISGVFIVVFKPFRVNDRLHFKDMLGTVEDITLRHTVIRDFKNRRILIPNSVISDEVLINSDLTDQKIVKWIEIGISYDSDIDLARKIMKEEIIKHPLNIDPRTPEQIEEGVELAPVRVISMGDFSVNLRGWAWAKDLSDAFILGCDLNESIKKRFDAEGVEIPFPYRTIVYKKDLS